MGEWISYRIAAWDTPLWALPNRREGRYNHAGQDQTQYLALQPLTPWAEVARKEGLRDRDELDHYRPPTWAVCVFLDPDPEPIDFDTAPKWGLTPDDLVSDDYGPCQQFADHCRNDAAMPKAIIVPSAALPGTENLVVFGPRIKIPYLAEPFDEQDWPVSLTAEAGVTPQGLESLIHQKRAGTHPALDAWKNGMEFEFQEPSTTHLSV